MPSSRTRRSFFPFTPAAACLFAALLAATTIAQTTQPLIARESAHLERVMRRLEQHPRLARDPYVRLEIAAAKRFLDRLRRGGGKGDNVHEWAVLQR